MGHPGIALSLRLERKRRQDGGGYGREFSSDHRGGRRNAGQWYRFAGESLGASPSRWRRARGRYRSYGLRPQDLGSQRILPGARRKKSICYGWRVFYHESGQESYGDDPGAVLAGFRVFTRTVQEIEPVG